MLSDRTFQSLCGIDIERHRFIADGVQYPISEIRQYALDCNFRHFDLDFDIANQACHIQCQHCSDAAVSVLPILPDN